MKIQTQINRRRVGTAVGPIVLATIIALKLVPLMIINTAQVLMVRGLLTDSTMLDAARDVFVFASRWQQADDVYLGLCRIDLAKEELASAYETCRLANATVYDIVNIGDVFSLQQGGKQKALMVYALARDIYPYAALVYYRLGEHYPAGTSPAVEAYQQAARLAESGDKTLNSWELAAVHVRLAQNYLWRKAYAQVVEEAQAALALAPHAQAYRFQAVAYAHLGQLELAQSSIEKAVQLDTSFWPYLEWGDVYRVAGQADLAAEKYWQAVQLTGGANQAWGYERLCQLYLATDNGDEALPICQTLVKRFGEKVRSILLLGDAYRLAGDDSAARTQYQKVLEMDPDNQQALKRLERP